MQLSGKCQLWLFLPTFWAESFYYIFGFIYLIICGKHNVWDHHMLETKSVSASCAGEVHMPLVGLIFASAATIFL